MHSKNRAALSYTLALNHLADRTPQELAALRGRRRSGAPNHGLPFPSQLYADLHLPESLDWRLYGEQGPGGVRAWAVPKVWALLSAPGFVRVLESCPGSLFTHPNCPQAR